MTVKSWLMRARNIDKEITALLDAKTQLYNRCTSTTITLGEKVSGGGQDFDKQLITLAAFYETIDKKIDELVSIKEEILQAISCVQDSTYRTILIERYINFKSLEEISVKLNYGYRHLCRLHGEALTKIKDVIQCP